MKQKQIKRIVHLAIYHPDWKIRKKNRKRMFERFKSLIDPNGIEISQDILFIINCFTDEGVIHARESIVFYRDYCRDIFNELLNMPNITCYDLSVVICNYYILDAIDDLSDMQRIYMLTRFDFCDKISDLTIETVLKKG